VIDRFLAAWEKQEEFCCLLFTSDAGPLIGSIAARTEDMPEAITAVVDWAFTQPWVSRVWAACDMENHSSARALERAGFSREDVLPQFSVHPNISSDPRDCYAYALTRGV
jgi:hypothetical protein